MTWPCGDLRRTSSTAWRKFSRNQPPQIAATTAPRHSIDVSTRIARKFRSRKHGTCARSPQESAYEIPRFFPHPQAQAGPGVKTARPTRLMQAGRKGEGYVIYY